MHPQPIITRARRGLPLSALNTPRRSPSRMAYITAALGAAAGIALLYFAAKKP